MSNVFNNIGSETVGIDGSTSTTVPINEQRSALSIDSTSSTATNANHDYTVGAGKYWILKYVMYGRAQAAGVYLRIQKSGGSYENLVAHSSLSTSNTVALYDMRLDAGDILNVNFATGTSGSIYSQIFYEEYTA